MKKQNEDPEKLMNKELQKKRDIALIPSSVAISEFAAIYESEFKLPLVWTNPVTNWHLHLWIAPQAGREWLTQEQIEKREKAKAATKKRAATVIANNRRREEEAKRV